MNSIDKIDLYGQIIRTEKELDRLKVAEKALGELTDIDPSYNYCTLWGEVTDHVVEVTQKLNKLKLEHYGK